MRNSVIALALLGLTSTYSGRLSADVRSDLKFDVVTEIDKYEVTEGHLFHAGFLWVGKARFSDTDTHKVEIYSDGGRHLVTTVVLPHSPAGIYPYDATSVLVVGRSSYPWKTHYSIIRNSGGTFRAQTTNLPEEYQVVDYGGVPGRMFFSEPGSASVFATSGRGVLRALPFEISGPGKLALDGNSLFILEQRSFAFGDEDIIKVNLADNSHARTFTDFFRNGLVNIAVMRGSPYLAGAEMLADQVLLIDRDSNKLVHTVAVEGEPRGLAQLGHCLLVSTEEKQGVTFIDLSAEQPMVIDRWDLTSADSRFRKARSISVDEETGRVFLRSTYMCPSCTVTQSSVVRVEQMRNEEGGVVQKCMNHQ